MILKFTGVLLKNATIIHGSKMLSFYTLLLFLLVAFYENATKSKFF